ncbi:hypothetical protein [Noviherbaspirillum saxi]|nr:hypothetical protein [Noviherbaspirillum saxi]
MPHSLKNDTSGDHGAPISCLGQRAFVLAPLGKVGAGAGILI